MTTSSFPHQTKTKKTVTIEELTVYIARTIMKKHGYSRGVPPIEWDLDIPDSQYSICMEYAVEIAREVERRLGLRLPPKRTEEDESNEMTADVSDTTQYHLAEKLTTLIEDSKRWAELNHFTSGLVKAHNVILGIEEVSETSSSALNQPTLF